MQQFHATTLVRWLVCGLLLAVAGAGLAAGSNRPEPVFTRYAGIDRAPTLDVRAEYFTDRPMQEMQDFYGYGLRLDFSWPINAMSQLEVLAPELLYTVADGWDLKAGLPFRLTSAGQHYAAEPELTFRL